MKNKQQQNILFILIPSTILIVLWIIFSVYNKSVMTTISQSQFSAIQPILPVFPTDVLADLKKRNAIAPLTSIDSVPNTIASSEATITPIPTPDPAALQTATDEGALGGTP